MIGKRKRRALWIAMLLSATTFAQDLRMRDLFASMPDSIIRLMTRNNRLDCIDFIENNMPAQVKNRADEPVELTALTDDYLRLQMSASSYAEMKILTLNDTLRAICLVRTYAGPVHDSSLQFFTLQWQPIPALTAPQPAIEDFLPADDSPERTAAIAQLRDLPFLLIQLSPNSPTLTLSLQPGELTKDERAYAQQHLRPLHFRWENAAWQRTSEH